ncbi:histone deacetylase [Verrucosispora sp. WMMD573]|uniref:histone deacetylase n=1 Tax=Verrucosispora sp. WMMD573 TaxID=3015149 RepID=UPI00248BCC76|nr:histone deacetylase [Verrucosispora sp. WMMD573]WBB56462.1 histone deacetylase [Verrucosispora sp. WMMD573]
MKPPPSHAEDLVDQVVELVDALTPEGSPEAPAHLWYVCYGSNMSLQRLTYYLGGGRPPAGALTYPGCRDSSPPSDSRAIRLPGTVYFALEARAWTGGMAFYDHDHFGGTPARAFRVTVSQFSDIMAQEMCLEPGDDIDLSGVMGRGRLTLGPGCYQTLLHLGVLDGLPAFTFTSPWRSHEVEHRKPAAVYLRHLAVGLAEAHQWSPVRIAAYLSSRPGAVGSWTPEEIRLLLSEDGTVTASQADEEERSCIPG